MHDKSRVAEKWFLRSSEVAQTAELANFHEEIRPFSADFVFVDFDDVWVWSDLSEHVNGRGGILFLEQEDHVFSFVVNFKGKRFGALSECFLLETFRASENTVDVFANGVFSEVIVFGDFFGRRIREENEGDEQS